MTILPRVSRSLIQRLYTPAVSKRPVAAEVARPRSPATQLAHDAERFELRPSFREAIAPRAVDANPRSLARGEHHTLIGTRSAALGQIQAETSDARSREIAAAVQALAESAPRVAQDPVRPAYHFAPPAGWINDPNGPRWFGGKLHLFYQANPFAGAWANIKWGHAATTDLIHFEHLPPALVPDHANGEDHCFSGSSDLDGDGVLILYTSVSDGPGRNAKTAAVQCYARSTDPDLVSWEQHAEAPVLTEAAHGDKKIYEWRDPFIFRHAGRRYVVAGGSLRENLGGRAVVPLYREREGQPLSFEYLGDLFEHPDAKNIECPNLLPLGDRWVLFFSPHDQIEARVGTLEGEPPRFSSQSRGLLDLGEQAHFYAPIGAAMPDGRQVVFGWIGKFDKRPDWGPEKERGWNGCLSLPRELWLRPDGQLGIGPAREVDALRKGPPLAARDAVEVGAAPHELGSAGDCFEVTARLERGEAKHAGITLTGADEAPLAIEFDGEGLAVGDYRAPFTLLPEERALDLRLFVDRSVLELFVNGRAALTRVLTGDVGPKQVALFAEGGVARFEAPTLWSLEKTNLAAG